MNQSVSAQEQTALDGVGRKLATIRTIDDIQPIPGADAIEVATIGGWKVVVKKGDFVAGNHALFCEIDSWVPTEVAPFLSKGKEPRQYNGVKGERLRTIKLRGQLSQGLLLPIMADATGLFIDGAGDFVFHLGSDIEEWQDVTELLGIQKWERPMNAQLAGLCRGNFPSFIRKTDQERCQNLRREIADAYINRDWFEVTEKLDGSSMTVYFKVDAVLPDALRGEDAIVYSVGVCSRNLELKLEGNDENAFVKTANSTGLLNALIGLGRNIAVQGELCGPGIQGNNEGLTEHRFYVFDIFDIDAQAYLGPFERTDIFKDLVALGADIERVPFLGAGRLTTDSIGALLQWAEGKNEAGNEREGLVFKRMDGKFSFKAISNKFLLAGGD